MELVRYPARANYAECDHDFSPVAEFCGRLPLRDKPSVIDVPSACNNRSGSYASVIVTLVPEETCLNAFASPTTFPTMLTGDAGLISSPRLIGVGP